MATKQQTCRFNAILESETEPVRISGMVGLVPDTVNGQKVMLPVGSVWIEPSYEADNVIDAFFNGSVVNQSGKPAAVKVSGDVMDAVLSGRYDGKGAKCTLQIHIAEKYLLIVIEATDAARSFPTMRFDSQAEDFNLSWEYFKTVGIAPVVTPGS